MKQLFRALVVIAGLTTGLTAMACGRSQSVDYCGPELIAVLYTTASGAIYVQPSSSWSGVVCTPISGVYAQLLPSASNFKQVYALLLSAKLSGFQVEMVMDPAQSQCTITYVTLQ